MSLDAIVAVLSLVFRLIACSKSGAFRAPVTIQLLLKLLCIRK